MGVKYETLSAQYADLQTQMTDLKNQNQTVLDFAAALNMDSAKSTIDFGSWKLEAGGVVAGAFTVKVVDPAARTIGNACIAPVDISTGVSGTSVFVKTTAVTKNSKVFVTPKVAIAQPLAVTQTTAGSGFEVVVKDPLTTTVCFDWWLVEESDNSSDPIDTSVPSLTEKTPISTPAENVTPTYIFTSSEAGTITYSGNCSSTTTTATTGDNSIVFNALVPSTYSDCALTVTDASGNVSAPLAVAPFTITTTPGN